MKRKLLTFFIWLIVAVLPLQGIAAATKFFCTASHQPAPCATLSMSQHHPSAGHELHLHNDAIRADSGHAGDKSTQDNHSCNADSACCFSACAPTGDLRLAPNFAFAQSLSLPSDTLLAEFIPQGLERPPRQ